MNNERDTWWLVERRGCQLWATGRGSFHSLTNDATRAERFASKFDAEEEIRCAEDHFRDELVATEHKFIGAVDPEGTNAQLLANALSRAEKAERDLWDEIQHSAKMREQRDHWKAQYESLSNAAREERDGALARVKELEGVLAVASASLTFLMQPGARDGGAGECAAITNTAATVRLIEQALSGARR